jgi:membrane-associated phospholipid phosphatase
VRRPGGPRSASVLAAVVICSLLLSAEARAEDDDFRWRWPLFRPSEYAATTAMAVTGMGLFFLNGSRDVPRVEGGILFDDAVRSAFRLRTASGRSAARAWSDVTAMTAVFLALGVDSTATPLVRGSSDVAYQMLLLDAEAYTLSTLISTATFDAVSRARPTYGSCRKDPKFDPLCHSGATASFWSGHTAQAFTAAGLSCAHHRYAELYGGGAPDAIACGASLSLAATTAVLRVTGDRHYATDVLAGALVGFAIGYGVPVLLHYESGTRRSASAGGAATDALSQGLRFTASGTF